jgi:hypothetical protein
MIMLQIALNNTSNRNKPVKIFNTFFNMLNEALQDSEYKNKLLTEIRKFTEFADKNNITEAEGIMVPLIEEIETNFTKENKLITRNGNSMTQQDLLKILETAFKTNGSNNFEIVKGRATIPSRQFTMKAFPKVPGIKSKFERLVENNDPRTFNVFEVFIQRLKLPLNQKNINQFRTSKKYPSIPGMKELANDTMFKLLDEIEDTISKNSLYSTNGIPIFKSDLNQVFENTLERVSLRGGKHKTLRRRGNNHRKTRKAI